MHPAAIEISQISGKGAFGQIRTAVVVIYPTAVVFRYVAAENTINNCRVTCRGVMHPTTVHPRSQVTIEEAVDHIRAAVVVKHPTAGIFSRIAIECAVSKCWAAGFGIYSSAVIVGPGSVGVTGGDGEAVEEGVGFEG